MLSAVLVFNTTHTKHRKTLKHRNTKKELVQKVGLQNNKEEGSTVKRKGREKESPT